MKKKRSHAVDPTLEVEIQEIMGASMGLKTDREAAAFPALKMAVQ